MSNPLYDQMHGKNDMTRVVNDFRQWKQQMQGIDPKQEVFRMLQNGAINQQQLNQFQTMARQLSGILK